MGAGVGVRVGVRVRVRVHGLLHLTRVRVRVGNGVRLGSMASSTWPNAKISSKKFLMACKVVR